MPDVHTVADRELLAGVLVAGPLARGRPAG